MSIMMLTTLPQAQALKEKGNLELWNKNYVGALEYFDKAIDADPNNMELPLSRAAALNSSGNFDAAILECQKTVDMVNKINMDDDDEDNDQAAQSNNTIQPPLDQDDMARILQMKSRAYARMGTAYLGSCKFSESKRCIVKAINTYNCVEFEEMLTWINELIKLSTTEAKTLFKQANQLYYEKRYDEATSMYTEAIAIDKFNNILYANRSMSYCKQKKFKEAIEDANTSIEIQETDKQFNYLPYYSKANALYAQSEYQESLVYYNEALKLKTDSAPIQKKIKKINLLLKGKQPVKTKKKSTKNNNNNSKNNNKNKNKNNNNVESNTTTTTTTTTTATSSHPTSSRIAMIDRFRKESIGFEEDEIQDTRNDDAVSEVPADAHEMTTAPRVSDTVSEISEASEFRTPPTTNNTKSIIQRLNDMEKQKQQQQQKSLNTIDEEEIEQHLEDEQEENEELQQNHHHHHHHIQEEEVEEGEEEEKEYEDDIVQQEPSDEEEKDEELPIDKQKNQTATKKKPVAMPSYQ
ncbi:hypothetical protein PPL_05628 [Heterostelium album PN500]|uniref:Uncharacterized protein n=1 Tax=Heterostelium pallidum (strain ATCC 26659 / Pp 5 / PN500) TaxID=670386 RepID=D3BAP9_HETP5|nr:hypothetical protein PPL_05628 [Heterostelium album PN500]EFA81636.1 hypothetical protein PPL_05628 [Heterostelium album PN500]|eukprot:XP_020433753.1 hypothetical protein PPL_05628 [Heterostelium album PN500]